ncbi:MAG: lipopolysaccharide biosynthesis protein [Phreatobacter sp.]
MPADLTDQNDRSAGMGLARAPALKPGNVPAQASEGLASKPSRNSRALAQRLASASVWALFAYVGGAALAFLSQLVIARLMGAASFGVYSYVLAWISVLGYASTLGFHVALMRFVPAYGARGQWSLARGNIRFALGWSLAAAATSALAGAVVVIASSGQMPPELAQSMLIGMAAVPLITLYLVGGAILRVLGGVVSALLPERIGRDGLLLVFVALLALTLSGRPDARLVIAALAASCAVTVVLIYVIGRRLWLPELRGVSPSYATGDWWPSVLPLMVITGLDMLMTRTGVMLLGWTGNIRDAGIFAVGFNVAMLIVLPRVAVGTMFAPTIAELHALEDRQAMQQVFANACSLSLAGAAALALPLLAIMRPLLRWFGQDFEASAAIAYILVIGQVFAAALGPQQNLLTMTGHERAAAAMMIGGAGLNILVCALWIPRYGPIGAAMATTLTIVAWNVAMAVYIHRHLGLVPGLAFALSRGRRPPSQG